MSVGSDEERLSKLGKLMRSEWDRRVSHDYRYWMSDGVESDDVMWRAGDRDFDLLIRGLDKQALRSQTALEIGCGVGRLLRPAAKHFSQVIGLDVSQCAVGEAKRLLAELANVELILGNGADLSGVQSDSIDFAFTFAALSSMPVVVAAAYISELSRVVRQGGVMRLQVYLGEQQQTYEEDTLAIRCFARDNFIAAVEHAGFTTEFVEELTSLPFEVSNKEEGIIAYIIGLCRNTSECAAPSKLTSLLVPDGEKSAGTSWTGSETEYLMSLARAEQHMKEGRIEEAAEALEFAVEYYDKPEQDICDMLAELKRLAAEKSSAAVSTEQTKQARIQGSSNVVALPGIATALGPCFDAELYQQNMRILRDRFPEAARALEKVVPSDNISVSRNSAGAAVISFQKLPLSHREKPERAGETWTERTLNSHGVRRSEALIIAGFADTYHLRALQRMSSKELHVAEPRPEILKTALAVLDCRDLLLQLRTLTVSNDAFREVLRIVDPLKTEFVIHPQTQAVSGQIVGELKRIFRSEQGLGQLRPNIGVVSPMYGGSLPIAGYASSALHNLQQRVFDYTLDPFYEGFLQFSSFLKNQDRRGIVESQYVEMLSQLVLEGVSERPVDILICLAQAPLTPRVLTEIRARGIITVMWFVEDCRRFLTWQQIAPYYDYMFLIQRDEFPRLVEQAGAGRAIYLPVGCDPQIHCPLDLTEEEKERFGSKLSFVGAGYNNRRHVFSALAQEDFKIWGTEWPACLPFTRLVQDRGARISVSDYVKVFNASTININLHSSQERDGVEPFGDFVNPRVFELAACGAFQLADNRKLLPEKFVANEEVATFSDERELREKCEYYLAHPEERAKICAAGRKRALAEHTYEHRLRTMLEYIYADRFEELSARAQQGPWPKTFEVAKDFPELHDRLQQVYERGEEPRMDSLVADITTGEGTLTETEQMLLFLHHIRSQISNVRKLRNEKSA